MNDLQQIGLFDYAGLPTVEAVEIRAAAERIKVRLKRTAEDVIAIGVDLNSVKEKLPHGSFGDWLDKELGEWGLKERTAHKFMQAAERFGDKIAQCANLKPAVLYLISSPSTPESVRAEVIERAEAGEKITLAEVEQLKREAAQALELKQRNTDLHKTIMDLAKQGDALKAELEARPEPAVIEKVVEKTVEVLPDDYEALQRKAAKLGELKDDLAAANEALAKLKAEQARKVEDGIRQGLRQRQAEIDDFERRKVELERMIQAQVKTLSEFDAERTANAEAAKALSAFALAVGSLSADLMGLEIDALHPEVAAQAARAEGLLVEALGFVSKLRGLPVARIEKEAA